MGEGEGEKGKEGLILRLVRGLQKLVFLETKHLSQELTKRPFKDLLFSRLFLFIYQS